MCYWATILMRTDEMFFYTESRMGLTRAMMIYRVPREGAPTVAVYPYERNGTKITWLQPFWPAENKVDPMVLDAIRQGYAKREKVWAQIMGVLDLLGLTLKTEDDYLDLTIGRFLSTQVEVSGASVALRDKLMYYDNGEEVAELARRSAGGGLMPEDPKAPWWEKHGYLAGRQLDDPVWTWLLSLQRRRVVFGDLAAELAQGPHDLHLAGDGL
jgi:hypothetical protein